MLKSWIMRSRKDQILDSLGLITQGVLIPLLATWIGTLVHKDAAHFQIQLPNWILFILPFTVVDYLYYWNHRLLHSMRFWFLHRVHHSSQHLDIWATSRNSIWTPLFLVYIWFHAGVIIYVQDPQFYIYGLWLMGAMDMWRHSGWPTPGPLKFLGAVFILPEDHEWHHSPDKPGINYGANLNIWDRMHKTFYRPPERANQLGLQDRGSLWDELVSPWRIKS